MTEIEFNKAKFDKLVKAHALAIKEKLEQFDCLGTTWVTKYAGYVIESLSPQFKNMK